MEVITDVLRISDDESVTCSNFVFCYKMFNSEFKIITSLKSPKFSLEDNFADKLDIICIPVSETKYCCKILNPKTGLFNFKIISEKKHFCKLFEIKNCSDSLEEYK